MGCAPDTLEDCTCKGDSQLAPLKDIYRWCSGLGSNCCSDIGADYESLGYSYTDSACRALNQTMVDAYPLECKIPCSASYPANCPKLSCDTVYNFWMELSGGHDDSFVKTDDPTFCCGVNNITCNENGGPIHM
jgi:hypothetical protein